MDATYLVSVKGRGARKRGRLSTVSRFPSKPREEEIFYNHQAHPLSRSSARVLVADENPEYLKRLGATMNMIGFSRLDLVSKGIDAVGAIASKDYDIAILDAEMTGVTGFYLSRTIRSQYAANNWPQPLILLNTGQFPFRYKETAAYNGADFALYKPLSKEELHWVFLSNSII